MRDESIPTQTPAALACVAPTLASAADAAGVALNVARIEAAVKALQGRRDDLAIVLLPLGCASAGRGLGADWTPQRLVDAFAAIASRLGVHVAGADRISGVAVGFVIAPDGRSIVQHEIGPATGAANVAVLPTPHGALACLVGDDLLQPEYARLALFAGAELLLNPAEERADDRSEARQMSRGARAWENHAFVASVTLGRVLDAAGDDDASFVGAGTGAIWDYSGQLVASGNARALVATLDPVALRQRRAEPWINFPAQLRTALYARVYAQAEADRAPPAADTDGADSYDALIMQCHQAFVRDVENSAATIDDNLSRALELARPFCLRPSTRLVVFPEFFLQGSDGSHPHEFWERVGIRIPGPETARLAAFARECGVYLCGAVLEYDPEWPLRYFNTSFIVSPAGEIVLRYRKLQCADLNGLLNITTPGNVYSAYVERYGFRSLVPWVDTPIGRLGTLICYDSNWPELWRALALNGVEVVCNPTSEIHSNRRQHWYPAKRAHAAENLVYVASANAGSEQWRLGGPVTGMNRGHSALIDYHGRLVACADGPGVVPLVGRIELGALRRARRQRSVYGPRFRPEAVAAAYAAFPGFPLDCFAEHPMMLASEGSALVQQQIERLMARGVYSRA